MRKINLIQNQKLLIHHSTFACFAGYVYPLFIVMGTNFLSITWALVMVREDKKEDKKEEKEEDETKVNRCLDFFTNLKAGALILLRNEDKAKRTQLLLLTLIFCLDILSKPAPKLYSLVQISWVGWGPLQLGLYKAFSSGGSSLFTLVMTFVLKKCLADDIHLFLAQSTSIIGLVIAAFTSAGWMFYLGKLYLTLVKKDNLLSPANNTHTWPIE